MTTSVLIADDSPFIRTAYKRILETQEDLEVSAVVEDGRAAVEAAEEIELDVAILDVRMPRLDGITAGKKIRESSPSTSIVIVSAFDDWTYIQDLVETDPSAKAYILKNSLDDIGELIRVVRQVRKGYVIFDHVLVDKLVGYYERHISEELKQFSKEHLSLISHYARGFDINEIKSILNLDDDTMESGLNHIFFKQKAANKNLAGLEIGRALVRPDQCMALDAK